MVVMKFLTEGEKEVRPPIKTHKHLRNIYGDNTFDIGTVRSWVKHFESVKTDIADKLWSNWHIYA